MKVHFVKSWKEYFEALNIGVKTFDLRYDDGRNYHAGDAIVFEEYEPDTKIASKYTGREIVRAISRVDKIKDLPGAQSSFASSTGSNNWVILSLRRVDEADFLALARRE